MIDIAGAQDAAEAAAQHRLFRWPLPRLRGRKDYGDLLAIVDDQEFWDTWRDKLVPLVEEVFGIVFRAGAQAGLTIEPATKDLLPLDPTAINNAFDRIVTTYTDEWWRQFIPSTQRQMRDSIRRAQAMGTGVEGVISDLEGIFGTQRAMTIASTETTRLFGLGAQAAYSAAGLDQWEWQTVEDFAVCAICRDRNKTRHPIATPFAPAHPRCRCFPRPVVDASTPDPGTTRRRRPRPGETDVQEPEQTPEPTNAYPKEGFQKREEIERWMHQKFPKTRFHFDGTDIVSANNVAREMDRLGSAWPQVMDRLEFVGSDARVPARWRGWSLQMSKNAYAFATRDNKVLMYNSHWFEDHAKLQASIERDRSSGWSPKLVPGTTAEAEIMAHEFGHHIDFFFVGNGQYASVTGFSRMSGLGLAGSTQTFVRQQHEEAGRKISRYGTTSAAEMWAESFAASQHGIPAAKRNAYVAAQTTFLDIFHPSKWQDAKTSRKVQWTGDIRDATLRDRANQQLRDIADKLGLPDI